MEMIRVIRSSSSSITRSLVDCIAARVGGALVMMTAAAVVVATRRRRKLRRLRGWRWCRHTSWCLSINMEEDIKHYRGGFSCIWQVSHELRSFLTAIAGTVRKIVGGWSSMILEGITIKASDNNDDASSSPFACLYSLRLFIHESSREKQEGSRSHLI